MSQKTARSEARSEAQTQLFSNLPTCPQEIPLPSGSTAEPFGCHNIFRKAVFPLWPIVFFVPCHNSLTPPPHPHPLSGAQIRSITGMGQKIWRHWCHSPCTAIFQNSGGLGGVAYKDRARPQPRGAAHGHGLMIQGQRDAPRAHCVPF